MAKQGQSLYSNVYRKAKVLRSSAFEGMLLKATWPDDEPVPAEILGDAPKSMQNVECIADSKVSAVLFPAFF